MGLPDLLQILSMNNSAHQARRKSLVAIITCVSVGRSADMFSNTRTTLGTTVTSMMPMMATAMIMSALG